MGGANRGACPYEATALAPARHAGSCGPGRSWRAGPGAGREPGLGRGGSRAVLAAAGGEEEAARLGRRAGHVLADYRLLGAAGPRAR